MTENKKPYYEQDFAEEVKQGLCAREKYLSSKYFYDAAGDGYFQKIMALPEYYLTDCEFEILDTYKEELGRIFSTPAGFDLIELGAGDGKKTKVLLSEFIGKQLDFTYRPIDISGNVLEGLIASLEAELPSCEVRPMEGNYFHILKKLKQFSSRRKVILFLGSTIGNFSLATAQNFLQKTSNNMEKEDLLLVGMDQQKDPSVILNAYNDSKGVTAAFNLNLLKRINRELGANFDVDSFQHWPLYDPVAGEARSYLISKKEQTVEIGHLDLSVHFREWEGIHTEISHKFSDHSVRQLAETTGLEIMQVFSDGKKYFKNYLFKKK